MWPFKVKKCEPQPDDERLAGLSAERDTLKALIAAGPHSINNRERLLQLTRWCAELEHRIAKAKGET